jgi:UDP-N-acetylmuramoylalanine--D-glutamate ligase
VDISDLVRRYSPKLKAAIVIGLDRLPVLEALAKYSPNTKAYEISADSEDVMNQVVRSAKTIATTGDAVLLAPAAASMDQFKDYAHRGELFAEAVHKEVQG